jgi:DNA-binding GntR family transcriptional regulator
MGARVSKKQQAATRADEIRQSIESDIFSGALRPGTRLDEESLASRFNLSRTPVREAILQLVYSGLVVKKPRQGAVVAPLDLHRMVQMFEVMSEVEGLCARYAARRMSAPERDALKSLHETSRQMCEARRLDEYYAVNHAFHEAIYSGSHNDVLHEMAHGLFARLAPYRRYQLNHPARIEESFREHGEVLDAVLAADPDRAHAAMRKHVTIQADIFSEFVSIMK